MTVQCMKCPSCPKRVSEAHKAIYQFHKLVGGQGGVQVV